MRLASLTLLTASSMLMLKQLAVGTYRKLWDLNSVVILLDTEGSVAGPVKQGAGVTKLQIWKRSVAPWSAIGLSHLQSPVYC